MMNILEEVKGCQTIGISGHIRPDGDCAGSCLGMALYLQKAMPGVRVDVFLENLSDALTKNLAGAEEIRHNYVTEIEHYDAFLCLDCEKERLGDALDLFMKAGKKINIDHHRTNSGSGDVNYIVPTASSTCELVYNTMQEEYLDERIARNLYIGMVTDTGVFMYSNTGRRTMEIAGRLMEFGFDFSAIVREVFYEKTYVQQQILGRALLESIRFLDGRCIVSMLDRKTMRFYQATSSDMDGIASELVHTDGVCCAIFMYETGTQEYKVSLRSCKYVDVSKIAEFFGGGGHVRAAGCTMNGSFYDVVNNLSDQIALQIKEQEIDQ